MGQTNMQVIGSCAPGWIPSGALGSEVITILLASGQCYMSLCPSHLAAFLDSDRVQPDAGCLVPFPAPI